MTAHHDLERRVADYYATEAPQRAPDRVLQLALNTIESTPQRRVLVRAPWRPTPMNLYAKVALAAAAVIAVAILGYNLLPGNGDVGGPSTPSPSPTVTPVVLADGDIDTILVAGTYRVEGAFGVPFSITFPTSWRRHLAQSGVADFRRVGPFAQDPWVNVLLVEDVFIDPCHTAAGLVAPRPATVDEYVTALTNMVGFPAGPVSDIDLDGHPGKFVELSNDIDTDTAGCTEGGLLPLMTFRGSDAVGAATNGMGRDLFWIVEVNGTIVVINSLANNEMSPATRAELEGVVLSMDFD